MFNFVQFVQDFCIFVVEWCFDVDFMAKINIHTHRPMATETTIVTAGIHPWDAATIGERAMLDMAESAESADAVGETGLDYACEVDKEMQESLFRYQLAIAECLRKPVVLHCVKAFEPMMNILDEYELAAVIFHGFIGSPEQALQAVKAGYYLSFGHRTFASPKSIEALRQIPQNRLFVETDDYDISIDEVYERVAGLLGVELENLEAIIEKNFETIFGAK